MPVYEYKCAACAARFEELILSDQAARQVACPHCGHRKVERLPSVFAAHAAAERPTLPRAECARCGNAGGCPMAG